jgi:hypothetical protein
MTAPLVWELGTIEVLGSGAGVGAVDRGMASLGVVR